MFTLLRHPLTATSLVAALIVAVVLPVTATSNAWTWKDQSGLLPYRDGVAVTQLSERQGSWLVSDGTHLARFDGSSMVDLTPEARAHGISAVASLATDGYDWLVTTRQAENIQTGVWKLSGSQWNDVTSFFRNSEGGLDATGQDGTWYVRSWSPERPGAAKAFTLFRWNGATAPEAMTLPANISTLSPGCLNQGGASVCTGVATPFYTNGAWYFVGGSAESRTTDNRVVQAGKATIWRLNGTAFEAMNHLPNFKFVSGVWTSDTGALIATSDSVTNPLASSHLYAFDGSTLRDLTNPALATGLLSVDAREIKATYTGKSWLIIAGKNVVRFDGTTMTRETPTRDLFHAIASDERGLVVLGGAVSTEGSAFASSPLTAKLVTMAEDLTQAETAPVPAATPLVQEFMSQTLGPTMVVSGVPQDGRIGNGKAFVLHAEARDASGVNRVDIYVNGARVKSCMASTCDYEQIYWTNGAPTKQVKLFARGVNAKGYGADSKTLVLTVDQASNATAYPVTNTYDKPAATQPSNTNTGTYDAWSGITWSTWTEPNTTSLPAGSRVIFNVSGKDANGLSKIDLWVNGTVVKTCTFNKEKDTRTCSFDLDAANYPFGTEVFANANIFDAKGKNAWTSAARLQRPVPVATNVATPTVDVQPAGIVLPTFASTASVSPNVSDVARGTIITFQSVSQNNTLGLARVELVLNGEIVRKCTLGAAVSPTSCDHVVDTATVAEGKVLTFSAHAIDNYGHDIWSNSKSVTVRSSNYTGPTASASGNFSAWSWAIPSLGDLYEGQTQTYRVGAWSPSGIASIAIVANGRTLTTCSGQTSGTLECGATIRTNDWSHGDAVNTSARVTDKSGAIVWTPVSRVRIHRTWEPVADPGAYVQVTTNRQDGFTSGDRVTVTAKGWAPNGVDKLELRVNGAVVATCSSDTCSWTSAPLTAQNMEFDAHLIDRTGTNVWSGMQGILRK